MPWQLSGEAPIYAGASTRVLRRIEQQVAAYCSKVLFMQHSLENLQPSIVRNF
jgi:hypothetical protein